jgi:hypothetical protein
MDAKTALLLAGGCIGAYVMLGRGQARQGLAANPRKRRNFGRSGVYQAALKEEAAHFFGLPPHQFDNYSYERWAKIRNSLRREAGDVVGGYGPLRLKEPNPRHRRNPKPPALGVVWPHGAKIKIIDDATNKWKTIGSAMDTPAAIDEEARKLLKQGYKSLWVFHSWGEKEYLGNLGSNPRRRNPQLLRVTFGGSNRQYNKDLTLLNSKFKPSLPLRTGLGSKRFSVLIPYSPENMEWVRANGMSAKVVEFKDHDNG